MRHKKIFSTLEQKYPKRNLICINLKSSLSNIHTLNLLWIRNRFSSFLWDCSQFIGFCLFFFGSEARGGGWSQNVITWHCVIDGPLKCQPDVLKTTAFRLINYGTNGYIKLLETNIPISTYLQSDSNGCSICSSVSLYVYFSHFPLPVYLWTTAVM